jgi:hypothetical protein
MPAVSDPSQPSGMHMADNRYGVPFRSKNKERCLPQFDQSMLMLEIPSVEEIAKTIWQRQRDALNPDAIHYNVEWRDQSIPANFWDEFILDAHAVLALLCKKNMEYQITMI